MSAEWGSQRVARDVVHVFPLHDAIDHDLDEAGDCICGPDEVLTPATAEVADHWRYDHHRLVRAESAPDTQ